jgi:hypothetical protein
MTEIRCSNCGFMNRLAALSCENCGLPFSNLPQNAFVSTETAEERQAYQSAYEPFGAPPPAAYTGGMPQYPSPPGLAAEDLGRKTFFWYRVYCAVVAALYFFVSVVGIFLALFANQIPDQQPQQALITGIAYAVIGAVFFLIYLIALVLPRKPYNWIVGIVTIAIGMTSCCMWPAVIPLLIYWVKPETKKFFGRE